MPLDPDPCPEGNVILGPELSTGHRLAQVLPPGDETPGKRYVAHFVTCPDAERYRKETLRRAMQSTAAKHGASLEPSHKCRIDECGEALPERMTFCGRHWRQLPQDLQRTLMREYRRNQVEGAGPGEVAPSRAWLQAAAAAVAACSTTPATTHGGAA